MSLVVVAPAAASASTAKPLPASRTVGFGLGFVDGQRAPTEFGSI
jgi:hypothetical protein